MIEASIGWPRDAQLSFPAEDLGISFFKHCPYRAYIYFRAGSEYTRSDSDNSLVWVLRKNKILPNINTHASIPRIPGTQLSHRMYLVCRHDGVAI